jgi:hypothetical protein
MENKIEVVEKKVELLFELNKKLSEENALLREKV